MIQVRFATLDDFDFIAALRSEAYAPYGIRHHGGWDDEEAKEYLRNQWPQRHRMVVQWEGEDVGYFGYRIEELAHLGNIIVQPEHRGKGIATVVLTDWLRRIDEMGLDTQLGVFVDNPAVALYRRLGFWVVERDPPNLVMRRSRPSC